MTTVTTDANGNWTITVPAEQRQRADETTLPTEVDVQTGGDGPTTTVVGNGRHVAGERAWRCFDPMPNMDLERKWTVAL
jgi:hypothetical protein